MIFFDAGLDFHCQVFLRKPNRSTIQKSQKRVCAANPAAYRSENHKTLDSIRIWGSFFTYRRLRKIARVSKNLMRDRLRRR